MSMTWGDLQKLAGEAGFTDAPAGTWEMEITKSTAGKTSNGKDMITVIFKIIAGPHAGATQFHRFVISPESAGAMAFFFRHMAALGFDQAFFAAYAALPPTQVVTMLAPLLVGKHALVTIAPRKDDADRLEVTGIKKAGLIPPMTPAQQAAGLSVFVPVPPAVQAAAQSAPPPPPVTAPAPVVDAPVTTPQEAFNTADEGAAPDLPF